MLYCVNFGFIYLFIFLLENDKLEGSRVYLQFNGKFTIAVKICAQKILSRKVMYSPDSTHGLWAHI